MHEDSYRRGQKCYTVVALLLPKTCPCKQKIYLFSYFLTYTLSHKYLKTSSISLWMILIIIIQGLCICMFV